MANVPVTTPGTCQYDGYTLPRGWYMLEVSPTDAGLGCILDITTYSKTQYQRVSGFQQLQLTNAKTSKRIIYLRNRSQSMSISSTACCPHIGAKRLVLIRLSANFAIRRMSAALQLVEWSNIHAYRSEICIDTLYSKYSLLCPAPSINARYDAVSKALSKPISASLDKSPIRDKFDLIFTDAPPKQTKRQHAAPYIILTITETQATEQLNDTLATIIDNGTNGTSLWYTDHDHVTADGSRVQARLKPCSNKGLLQQGNYIGPLLICTQELYTTLGGIDRTLEDSAILHFLLRAFDVLQEFDIKRIPHISYSIPVTHYHGPHGLYCGKHDRQAFHRFLSTKSNSEYQLVDGLYPKTWSLAPLNITSEPAVEIIIATRDRVDLLEHCIDSIFTITRYKNYTITVVDNDSVDTRTHTYHQRMSDRSRYRKIDYSGEFNFSAINNLAAAQSDADILVLLNNDTQVQQANWLHNIVSQLADLEIACVGTRLIYPNGLLQHAGIVTGILGIAGHTHRFATEDDDGYGARIRLSCDVTAVTGACLGIRRAVYSELNGLDELNLKVAYNDVDFCLRARNAGYRNRYLANVTLTHHESISRGTDETPEKRKRFRSEYEYMEKTHTRWLTDDPTWHPHFSKAHTTPVLTVSDVGISPIG